MLHLIRIGIVERQACCAGLGLMYIAMCFDYFITHVQGNRRLKKTSIKMQPSFCLLSTLARERRIKNVLISFRYVVAPFHDTAALLTADDVDDDDDDDNGSVVSLTCRCPLCCSRS